METVLFLTNVEDDGTLSKASREALSRAVELRAKTNGSLVVGLWGGDAAAAAGGVAGCGADRVLVVGGADFAPSRFSTDAAAAEAIAREAGPTLVIAPATPRCRRALPAAAARLGGRIDTAIGDVALDGGQVRADRWIYRQRVLVTIARAARPWFLLVDAGSTEPFTPGDGGPVPETVPVALGDEPRRTRVIGIEAASKDAQTIRPDSEMLFVAGAGWTKKQPDGMAHPDDAERHILGFLDRAGASLGSSKSLVDQSGEGEDVLSFMSHLNQVGQTGSTPRHAKGLATCCHGEEPHVVGWRFIRERRAINLDPNCGWAQGKADVLYVANAFEIIGRVNEKLAALAGVEAES